MKHLVLLLLLCLSIYASSIVEHTHKCIDNKLFIQTVVYESTQYGKHIQSASLVQVLEKPFDVFRPQTCNK